MVRATARTLQVRPLSRPHVRLCCSHIIEPLLPAGAPKQPGTPGENNKNHSFGGYTDATRGAIIASAAVLYTGGRNDPRGRRGDVADPNLGGEQSGQEEPATSRVGEQTMSPQDERTSSMLAHLSVSWRS